jgi:putative phosphoesterase
MTPVIRAAVFSDTHTSVGLMLDAVRSYQPDVILHLGDHDRDTGILKTEFPDIPVHVVRGNCDYVSDTPLTKVVTLGGVKAFLCHGHSYGVGWGDVSRLVYAAQEQGCRLAFYGHTHIADRQELGGVQVINPGTAGKGRLLSWARVEVYENGAVTCDSVAKKII